MDDPQSPTNTTRKAIEISGQHNKYMMKKVTKTKQINVNKKNANNINSKYYDHTYQLNNLLKNDIIISSIKNKINSYKNQDVLKKRLDKENLISYEYVCQQLSSCNMTCHYCNIQVFIIYKQQRDMQQWTLDRIDNDVGHNTGNVVISCLACNLQRKTRNADKFLTTKQLIINRVDDEIEDEDNQNNKDNL